MSYSHKPLGAEVVLIVPTQAKRSSNLIAAEPDDHRNGFEVVRDGLLDRFRDGISEHDGFGSWTDSDGYTHVEKHVRYTIAACPKQGTMSLAEELASFVLANTAEHCVYYSVGGFGYLAERE